MRSAVVSASSSWSIKRIQLIYALTILLRPNILNSSWKMAIYLFYGDLTIKMIVLIVRIMAIEREIKWDMEATPLPFDPYHPVPIFWLNCFTIHQPEIMPFGDDPRNVRSLWLHLATWLWPGIFMGILDDKHLETQVWEWTCWFYDPIFHRGLLHF